MIFLSHNIIAFIWYCEFFNLTFFVGFRISAIKTMTGSVTKLERELADYKKEVLKIIRGESAFTASLLSELISQTEEQIKKSKDEIVRLEESRTNEADRVIDLKKQYDTIVSWAQMYDESSFEAKKMIAAALIKSVKIYNGNRMEFDFNLGVEQFLSEEEIAVRFDYGTGSTRGIKKKTGLRLFKLQAKNGVKWS